MSKVLVMTDTVACIPDDLAKESQIKRVPAANIIFEDKTYIDGVTLSAADAYELIKKDPDKFMTSAVTPSLLIEEYSKIGPEFSEVLFITLSSALSAAFKTATLAAENFKEKSPQTTIKIFDSKSVGGGQGLTVLAAAKAAKKGLNLDQITAIAEKARQSTRGIMMLDTLRYVYRTGCMSKIGSRIASMFNIRPINKVTEDGRIEMVDRTRNREAGLERMIEIIGEDAGTDKLHFMLSHAAAPDIVDIFKGMIEKKFNCLSIIISDYSPVMGYGAGPGAIFVGYQPELNLPV
ncbi:DegV family protein [Chloroflexota bacterium]